MCDVHVRKPSIEECAKAKSEYDKIYRETRQDKEAHRKANMKSYFKHREAYLERMRVQYRRLKTKVLMHYDNKCACCGEAQPLFLTVDHMNNDGWDDRRKRYMGSAKIYRFLIKNNFPPGYQILCFNCNSGRGLNGNVCPHISDAPENYGRAHRGKYRKMPMVFGHV